MGISTVVFRVGNSGGVFRLNVSGNARFFPAVQTAVIFSCCNFLEILFWVLKLGIKTNVPIFKSEAGEKRE